MPQTHSQTEACATLVQEHRQMEALLDRLAQALTTTPVDRAAVQRAMAAIVPDMNTHFACEEQVLFPAVTPYHPMVLMEVEHEELIALRTELLTLLEAPAAPAADANNAVPRLQAVGHRFIHEMRDHIAREDAGIFPACERALSEDEKALVIAGMAAIRQQAETIPTPAITRPERTFAVYPAELATPLTRDIMARRLFEDATIDAKQITVQAGKALAEHWTPHKALLVCLAGEGTFTANGQQQPLSPGTVVAMSPQLRHAIAAQTRCDLLLLLQKAVKGD